MRLKKLSRDFALEASGVDLARPLSDGAFREIEEAFFAGQVLVFSRAEADGAGVSRIRAPLRAARAARGRPVPPSRIRGYPDPVQRGARRQAGRACDAGLISIPTIRIWRCRRGRRCCTRSRCRARAAIRCLRTSIRLRRSAGATKSGCKGLSACIITATATISRRPRARPPRS